MKEMVWLRARTPATLTSRLVLGLVFALAAASKITASGPFRTEVAAYHLLPSALVAPFALALPWIEALLALYLLIGLFLRPAAIVTAILLLVFIGALTISLIHGNTAHGCGCLPTSGPLGSLPFVTWLAGGATITPFDVVRDVVFVGLSAVIYWGDRYALSLDALLFGARDEIVEDDETEPALPQVPPPAARRSQR